MLKLPRLGHITVSDSAGASSRELERYWDTLCTDIENAVNRIGTVEGDILTINGQIGDVSAEGLFKVVQGTTTGGAEATIELLVRAGVLEAFRAASLKISALAAGLSRIEITADEIILDGTVLSNGAILTGHLESGAATGHEKENFSGVTSTNNTTWNDLTATGVTIDFDSTVDEEIELDLPLIVHNSDAGDHPIQVRLLIDGGVLKSWPSSGTEAFTCQKSGYTSVPFGWHDAPSTGSHVYKAQWRNPSLGTTVLEAEGTLRVDNIKR